MKRIIYITAILVLANTSLHAQMIGKKFIQGNAMINFDDRKLDGIQDGLTSNNYGYSFDLLLGKFKKENVATGWLLGSSLGGGKSNYILTSGGEVQVVDKSGINKAGISVGRFWHFYKPFSEKFGVYGGPDVRLSYNYTNDYETNSTNSQYLAQTKSNAASISLGLTGSVYYTLSDRWWLEASFAYANPIFLKLSGTQNGRDGNLNIKTTAFSYQLSPQLALPSVGLGLRYFLK